MKQLAVVFGLGVLVAALALHADRVAALLAMVSSAAGAAKPAYVDFYPGKTPPAPSPSLRPQPKRGPIEILPLDRTTRRTFDLTLERDETVSLVAEWCGVPLDSVLAQNGLRKGAVGHPGQTLRITMSGDQVNAFFDGRKRYHRARQARFYEQYDRVKVIEDEVRKGETLQGFLKRQRQPLEVWHLEELNSGVDFRFLPAGKRLVVPIFRRKPHAKSTNPNVHGTDPVVWAPIKVRLGESLWHFADWSGTETEQIRADNQLPGEDVDVGTPLNVRMSAKRAKTFDQRRAAFEEQTVRELEARYFDRHTLARGETLWGLSTRYAVDAERLKDYNSDKDFRRLAPGAQIRIPKTDAPFAGLQALVKQAR